MKVEPNEILAFAKSISGLTLQTLDQQNAFTVTMQGDRIWYTPISTGKRRPQSMKALSSICARYSTRGSFVSAYYTELSAHSSYTLALISAYIESRTSNRNVLDDAGNALTSDAETLMKRIQMVLRPEDLKPEYRAINASNPMYGHCYVATEVLYHILRRSSKSEGFKPHRGTDDKGVSHWWLQDSKGNILDPTKEQYLSVGRKPPYENGKRSTFRTKQPSYRAVRVMDRLKDLHDS